MGRPRKVGNTTGMSAGGLNEVGNDKKGRCDMSKLEFDTEPIGLTDAAKFLLVSKVTLIDLARAGTVPGCKIGSR